MTATGFVLTLAAIAFFAVICLVWSLFSPASKRKAAQENIRLGSIRMNQVSSGRYGELLAECAVCLCVVRLTSAEAHSELHEARR